MDQMQSTSKNIGKWMFRHTNTYSCFTQNFCKKNLQNQLECDSFVCFLIIFNVGVLWTLTCSF